MNDGYKSGISGLSIGATEAATMQTIRINNNNVYTTAIDNPGVLVEGEPYPYDHSTIVAYIISVGIWDDQSTAVCGAIYQESHIGVFTGYHAVVGRDTRLTTKSYKKALAFLRKEYINLLNSQRD